MALEQLADGRTLQHVGLGEVVVDAVHHEAHVATGPVLLSQELQLFFRQESKAAIPLGIEIY